MDKYEPHEAEILKFKFALDVVSELKEERILSMYAGNEVIGVLNIYIARLEHNLATIIGEDIDAHRGAAFQRYCTAQGIDKDVSLAMYIIGDRIRPHYYPTDADAILHAAPGFSLLPKIIEL